MTFPVPGGADFLRARNNLSDVANPATALANLGGSSGIIPTGMSAHMLGLAILTNDPGVTTNEDQLAAQEMFWVLCMAAVTRSITIMGTWLTQAGIGPGAGVNQMALYSEAGALLTTSADCTTGFESTGVTEVSCTPYTVTAGTNYYMAIVCNFASQAPKIPINGVNDVPSINGHYPLLFQSGNASIPSSFTPSALSQGFDSWIMWAR